MGGREDPGKVRMGRIHCIATFSSGSEVKERESVRTAETAGAEDKQGKESNWKYHMWIREVERTTLGSS